MQKLTQRVKIVKIPINDIEGYKFPLPNKGAELLESGGTLFSGSDEVVMFNSKGQAICLAFFVWF